MQQQLQRAEAVQAITDLAPGGSGAVAVDPPPSLLDPSLLVGLTSEQRAEALAAAAAAQRAEERAEQRALQRALEQREAARKRERELEEAGQAQRHVPASQQQLRASSSSSLLPLNHNHNNSASNGNGQTLVFVSKRQRLLQQQKQEQTTPAASAIPPEGAPPRLGSAAGGYTHTLSTSDSSSSSANRTASSRFAPGGTMAAAPRNGVGIRGGGGGAGPGLSDKEVQYVRQTYLGKSGAGTGTAGAAAAPSRQSKDQQQPRFSKQKVTFKFRWDNTDDTLPEDDPLYAPLSTTTLPPNASNRAAAPSPSSRSNASSSRRPPQGQAHHPPSQQRRLHHALAAPLPVKPLDQMTPRDWRIVRENYEIHVRGGRAPPPLRSFRECHPPLHPSLLHALEQELRFVEPTPIQRQAVPIGLQRRDLMGIAETGSGKTVAFGLPLCHYLLELPPDVLHSVAHQGPLALVLAPTRELALQIQVEISKLLSRQTQVKSLAVVGGQSIQHQSQQLRAGVHIVVGTPGRINEILELAYLVLNQCAYVVLDEADRMVDMGFAPQIASILDAMGCSLKSDIETEAYQQELEDLQSGKSRVAKYRVTAMFSATMPLDVEVMAKTYLRHPAVVTIGDPDSSKNARIVQKLVFTTPPQKEKALHQLLMDPRFLREKVLVFVNEKKHADGVGRLVERSGRDVVVMHGGKSQEQREDHLERFRRGGVVMVATDVAGRGLDIPDVAHVINYDLPTRSIENYTHRIGRTGRAGKQGLATSLITDDDQGIMAALKQYLESTGNEVPERLARHPAAMAAHMQNVID